jgi:uncharacterized protein (DUF2384 family)
MGSSNSLKRESELAKVIENIEKKLSDEVETKIEAYQKQFSIRRAMFAKRRQQLKATRVVSRSLTQRRSTSSKTSLRGWTRVWMIAAGKLLCDSFGQNGGGRRQTRRRGDDSLPKEH